ncbi:MAG: YciI family protein [Sphingobacteriales bacterium]
MKKYIILITLTAFVSAAFAQQPASPAKLQFLFIVRYNTSFKPASKEAVQNNIKKWQDYMGGLAKSGNLAGGYRPDNDGVTISGTEKSAKSTPYMSNGELVSSILIIKADNLDAAKAIADNCPIFEFGGSVEVRPITDIAGQ